MSSCTTVALEQFVEILANKIGPQRYKVWFANLAKVELTDSTVAVTVPNNFVGNWIQKHYANLLLGTANEVVGHDCKLQVRVSEETVKNSTKQSPQESKASPTREKRKVLPGKARLLRPGQSLRFSLDDFVVGPSNQLAFATAQSIVGQNAALFNPLFIHGSCGLGKTHLLQGICNAVRTAQPQARCIYISGEEFTNRFIRALRSNRVNAFRQHFRQLDLLAIDDIHFLANKRATQEEFLHTFNSIETHGKQVILASDAHPKLLGKVIDSLVSRFLAGMVVKIEAPDYETRLAILLKQDQRLALGADKAVLEYVAQHVRGNVRELEGAILKLKAYGSLSHQVVSLPMATRVLADHLRTSAGPVAMDTLQQTVADYFGLSAADLQSTRRNNVLSLARSLAMYLAREHTRMSYPEIGRAFGRRSHASVIAAHKKVERFLEEKKVLEWTTVGGRAERQNTPQVVSKLSEQISKDTRKDCRN